MSFSPAPKSPDRSDKNKRYDRQIRLWGDNGQILLENANICLINANALGCEVLKSLVLPGIGAFTMIDGSLVTDDDLGNNFFLEERFIGKSRGAACTELLQELNPDVKGDFAEESLEYILCERSYFFDNFHVVFASNLCEDTLLKLSNVLWEANVPFVYCRSLGMFGTIRLQVREHCVIETHPDNVQYDLRIENPFENLKKFLENHKITPKVPWPVILYKYLNEWKQTHNNASPVTYKEKVELRDFIKKDLAENQDNYNEAIKAVNYCFNNEHMKNVLNVFDCDQCINLTKQSKPFWIMIRALKDFVQEDNGDRLPLPGVLPDMTADTETFIHLQNIYRQQALLDSDNVYRRCKKLLTELGRPIDVISEKDVRLLCREAMNITVIKGTKISGEYVKNSDATTLIEAEMHGKTLIEYYVALRAYERYLTECGTIPGEGMVEKDTARYKITANKILADWGFSHASLSDDIVHEICHLGGAEFHSISSFIGGCAAQEIIKIITKQYIPLNNTLLYNGITSETLTLRMESK